MKAVLKLPTRTSKILRDNAAILDRIEAEMEQLRLDLAKSEDENQKLAAIRVAAEAEIAGRDETIERLYAEAIAAREETARAERATQRAQDQRVAAVTDYDQARKALEDHRQRADAAERERDQARTALTDAKNQTELLTAMLKGTPDTHMDFAVVGPDGEHTMKCADWCYACKLQAAQQRVEELTTEAATLRSTWQAVRDYAEDLAASRNFAYAKAGRETLARLDGRQDASQPEGTGQP